MRQTCDDVLYVKERLFSQVEVFRDTVLLSVKVFIHIYLFENSLSILTG